MMQTQKQSSLDVTAEITGDERGLPLEGELDASPPPQSAERSGSDNEADKPSPPFDKLILGGTFSLGVLLLIGGIVILCISLVERSNFQDTSLDDFISLGPDSCQILDTVSYQAIDQELNALNSFCREDWTYNVQVLVALDFLDNDSDENTTTSTTFVSESLSSIPLTSRCRTTCNLCEQSGVLLGEDHYIGVFINKAGETIGNETLEECFAPAKDPSELSKYYNCQSNDATQQPNPFCLKLQDPRLRLEELQTSNELGFIAAYVGLVGGVVFLALAYYFYWKNRQYSLLQLKQSESNC